MMWWLVLGKAEDDTNTNTNRPTPKPNHELIAPNQLFRAIPCYSVLFRAFWALLHRKNPKSKVKPKHTPRLNQYEILSQSQSQSQSLNLNLNQHRSHSQSQNLIINTDFCDWFLVNLIHETYAEGEAKDEADTKAFTFAYSIKPNTKD